MRTKTPFLLACLLLFLLMSCTSGHEYDPLLSRAFIAHGGNRAIEGGALVHASGSIKAVFLGDEGTYEYWFQREGRLLRVETRYARHSETRVLEGTSGLRGQGGGPLQEVSGFRYEAMLYQFKHIDILFGILSGSYNVEDRGEASTPAGRKARAFGLRDKEGPPITLYVDPDEGMIEAVTGHFDIDGKTAELSTEFYDYRRVNGLMVPFRVVNYAGGAMIAETVFESYSIKSR